MKSRIITKKCYQNTVNRNNNLQRREFRFLSFLQKNLVRHRILGATEAYSRSRVIGQQLASKVSVQRAKFITDDANSLFRQPAK